MNYRVNCLSENGNVNLTDDKIIFVAGKKTDEAFFFSGNRFSGVGNGLLYYDAGVLL